MAATDLSPNTDNYYMGQGIVKFRGVEVQPDATTGERPWRDLGNVPRFEFSTSVTKRDHYSSRTAVRSKDKTAVTGKDATVGITLEEFTGPNLAMFLLGLQTGEDAAAVLEIGRHNDIRGELLFVGTNEMGPKWNFYFDNVAFNPDGSLNAIGEDWGAFQLNGDIHIVNINGVDRFGLAARALSDIPAASNA